MDVEAEIAFALDVRLDVRHLEVIVDPINYEVGEPRILPANLEQLIKELEAFLSKVVPEYFETHECLILRKGLGE
jgi:hypothetical protein